MFNEHFYQYFVAFIFECFECLEIVSCQLRATKSGLDQIDAYYMIWKSPGQYILSPHICRSPRSKFEFLFYLLLIWWRQYIRDIMVHWTWIQRNVQKKKEVKNLCQTEKSARLRRKTTRCMFVNFLFIFLMQFFIVLYCFPFLLCGMYV